MDDQRLCDCGKHYISIYAPMCGECREKQRFEEAEKIKPKDYKYDVIYDPKSEDCYMLDELEEHYEEIEEPLPDYVYGCIPTRFGLDMHSIVENELQNNHYEGAFSDIDSKQLEKIQEIVDKWTEEQDITSWEQDCKTVILLEKESEE